MNLLARWMVRRHVRKWLRDHPGATRKNAYNALILTYGNKLDKLRAKREARTR